MVTPKTSVMVQAIQPTQSISVADVLPSEFDFGPIHGLNHVSVDRSLLHPRHNKALDRMVRAAIPFAYGFFHIETEFSLRIRFSKLSGGTRGTFGYPMHNSHRTVEINLSARDWHQRNILETFFHEITHFWQMLDGRNDPHDIAYFRNGGFCLKTYREDPLEIEARQMGKIMLDSYERYRNNYRGIVPCSVSVNDYVHIPRPK